MLKITRSGNGEVVFSLSGRMEAENVGELETLLSAEASAQQHCSELERPETGGSGRCQFS